MTTEYVPTAAAGNIFAAPAAEPNQKDVRKTASLIANTNKIWINQVGTNLPDAVVYAAHTKELPFQSRSQGVLMFLDISGFTSLCEKYSMNTRNGTDQLTKTLNGYMEALVNEILISDGDVLKFAGDAILTMWKVDSFQKMKSTVAHVIDTSLNIQRKYGEWTTSVGVKLRVKIGIAAGEINITFLGNNEFCHYVTMGRAVESVNMAEKFCVSGDTVVSPSAWCHCANLDTDYEVLSDMKHIKLLEINLPPSDMNYESVNIVAVPDTVAMLYQDEVAPGDADAFFDSASRAWSRASGTVSNDVARKSQTNSIVPQTENQQGAAAKRNSKDITGMERPTKVRMAIIDKQSEFSEWKLRLYVAPPVMKKLEEHQPLEYLSEMRQVTIVFINLSITHSTNYELTINLQKAFDIIYTNVKRSQGCLNKIFMFDKGCTFLVIFGLPGYKHENDCAHALQCAYHIRTELCAVQNIEKASIGVTTGSSFCGVVGHSHRHEYTVIGRKVNMAARLMMYYKDTVTCDNETFHHSKLSRANFTPLELKEMKGLSNVGIIREYKPTSSIKEGTDDLAQHEMDCPIIGRDKELHQFEVEMRAIRNNPEAAAQRQLIVFEGEPGIGKTRMLDSVVVRAHVAKTRVISCRLTMHDAKTPYYAMKTLLMDLMQVDYDMTHQERENTIVKHFKDSFVTSNICLFNNMFLLKLPLREDIAHLDTKTHSRLLHDLLLHMLTELTATVGFILFTIDDAHFMDPDSWDFISTLGHNNKTLVVMTCRMPFTMCATATRVLAQDSTINIQLECIDPAYQGPLACQLLGVIQIPQRLEQFLREKSHGVPSWCEQLLKEMLYGGVIRIETGAVDQKNASTPSRGNQRASMDMKDMAGSSPAQAKGAKVESGSMQLICVISSEKLLDVAMPDSIKGMIQARIDRMEELDQMILKTGSILGMTFARVLLEVILPNNPGSEKVGEALQRLADTGIFMCASPLLKHGGKAGTSASSAGMGGNAVKNVTCTCRLADGTCDEKPMRECRFLRFQAASTQETAYQMFLENARSPLHVRAARYLEAQAHKCKACGGGDFLQNLVIQASIVEEERPQSAMFKTSHQNARQPQPQSQPPACDNKRGNLSTGLVRKVDRIFRRERLGGTSTKSKRRTPPDGPSVESDPFAITTRKRKVSAATEAQGHSFSNYLKSNVVQPMKPEEEIQAQATRTTSATSTEFQALDNFTSLDLRECECVRILSFVYPQLVRHWRAAGNIERTVHFLMEAGTAALAVSDNLQGVSYLKETQRIIECVKQEDNPFEGEVANTTAYHYDEWIEARMLCLFGQALFHMGQMEESVPYFKKSLELLNCPQPRTKLERFIMKNRESFLQWKHIKFPSHFIGKATTRVARNYVEQCRCLSHLVHWHLAQRHDEDAGLAVLLQLNRSEAADCDLHERIMAYTCMMQCCQVFNWSRRGQQYEAKALARCIGASTNMSADDLLTIAHGYCTSLSMRLAWGRIPEAIDSGYIAKRLTSKLHDNDMQIAVLPVLAHALLLTNRIGDCVDILKELDYLQSQNNDQPARIWYYVTCFDLILETGFQLEHFRDCIAYIVDVMTTQDIQCSPNLRFYVNCCLALWFMRKGEMEQMEECRLLATRDSPTYLETYTAACGFAKLLEIKLILLSSFLARSDGQSSQTKAMDAQIRKDLSFLCGQNSMHVIQPRACHLSAYYSAIKGHGGKARKLLGKCVSLADQQSSVSEAQWAAHSQEVWFDPDTDKTRADFWMDHSDEDMLDWHMAEKVEASVIKYSLPLPRYFSHVD